MAVYYLDRSKLHSIFKVENVNMIIFNQYSQGLLLSAGVGLHCNLSSESHNVLVQRMNRHAE